MEKAGRVPASGSNSLWAAHCSRFTDETSLVKQFLGVVAWWQYLVYTSYTHAYACKCGKGLPIKANPNALIRKAPECV